MRTAEEEERSSGFVITPALCGTATPSSLTSLSATVNLFPKHAEHTKYNTNGNKPQKAGYICELFQCLEMNRPPIVSYRSFFVDILSDL